MSSGKWRPFCLDLNVMIPFWRCGRCRVSVVVADGLNQYRIIAIHIQERTSAKLTIENNIA